MESLLELWLLARQPNIHADGTPRAHQLTPDQRAALMLERAGPVADLVLPQAWHHDSHSPRSSQVLCIEVVGVLRDADLLRLLHPDGSTRGCDVSLKERARASANRSESTAS